MMSNMRQENADLARQVQLLVHQTTLAMPNTPIQTSEGIIESRLITFDSIVTLHTQYMTMLQVVRNLSAGISRLEEDNNKLKATDV